MIIRASEIGSYLYCQRAWWYQRQGYESENLAELEGGIELHERHGRVLLTSNCLRVLAYGLLLLAMVLFVIHAVSQLI